MVVYTLLRTKDIHTPTAPKTGARTRLERAIPRRPSMTESMWTILILDMLWK